MVSSAIFPLTRRAALSGLAAAAALGRTSASFGASAPDPRLIVINVRGGLDGLAAVIPYGDMTNLNLLRASLVPAGFQPVDPMFALHPSLPNLTAMFGTGEALAVHAVGPCGVTRSHFAGQFYLQSGAGQIMPSGWLNRALQYFNAPNAIATAVSIDTVEPLLMRGPSRTSGWAPDPYAATTSSLTASLASLTANDPLIGPAVTLGNTDRTAFEQILANQPITEHYPLPQLATITGTLLAAPNGPRVATLETGSFDTHAYQNVNLPPLLTDLDNAIANLKIALGSAWASTVVLTMTEFGRVAYVNGTEGSDHGTGFAVFLAGGAIKGGKVMGMWPGIDSANLISNRDLAGPNDFRSIAMGVLSSHLGISTAYQQAIFPNSTNVVPMTGLTN